MLAQRVATDGPIDRRVRNLCGCCKRQAAAATGDSTVGAKVATAGVSACPKTLPPRLRTDPRAVFRTSSANACAPATANNGHSRPAANDNRAAARWHLMF